MSQQVYTIGYSGFSIDAFIETLKLHGIRLVVDIRSSPFSGYFADYNKDALEQKLKQNGIYYRNYASEFGARQEDKKLYTKDGYLDFDRFAQTQAFSSGMEKLCNSMAQGYTFALMCAEKDPIRCHRSIMVSRRFHERGYDVIHILPDNMHTTQQDLELRLLNKFFPDRNQFTLFSTPQDDQTLIAEAYRLQNAEIGYRMEET